MSWMRLRGHRRSAACSQLAASEPPTPTHVRRGPAAPGPGRIRTRRSSGGWSALAAGSLTTDQAADPLGIDTATPQLGWVINSSASGLSQSSYEIGLNGRAQPVQRAQPRRGSSQVSSRRSFDISYAGSALASQTRDHREVRVRDNHGNASQWSRPAWFETAFLDSSQFQGSWIGDANSTSPTGPELLLRKAFALRNAPITRARLYVSGLSFPYTDIDILDRVSSQCSTPPSPSTERAAPGRWSRAPCTPRAARSGS